MPLIFYLFSIETVCYRKVFYFSGYKLSTLVYLGSKNIFTPQNEGSPMTILNQSNALKLGIAMYQPDIPQNVGSMMRLAACMGLRLDIIEPCGFPWDDKKIQRAGMDYIQHVDYKRHNSWQGFYESRANKRVVLMTTKTENSYLDFAFQPGDIVLAGRESSGVPQEIHDIADARITIPMYGAMRSLNIVNATSMILGEAIRQTEYTK
jgi:tRNA (cytidine/uridine-2'-O-)-methyltransferase